MLKEESASQGKKLAGELAAEVEALPVRNADTERAVRRKYSERLEKEDADVALAMARELIREPPLRWIAYELIGKHKEAFKTLGVAVLEELGEGIDSWWAVDGFARILAGPAWTRGQVPDELIWKWAHSEDLWWRRAALVSTVAWNMRSQGGKGDAPRTLKICQALAADHEDMVVKALSWALRQLSGFEPQAVQEFLEKNKSVLAARIKYEVGNKLRTGLKTPRLKKAN